MRLSTRAASHGYCSGLAAGTPPLIFGGEICIDLVGAASGGTVEPKPPAETTPFRSLELIRHG